MKAFFSRLLVGTGIVLAATSIAPFGLTGCAEYSQQIQALEPPAAFQADITWIGGRAKQYISAENQSKIHNFAVQLQTTANLDLSALYALLPTTTGSVSGDLLLNTAKTTLQLVVIKYGSNNATTIAYAHAAALGLLANF